MSTLTPNLQLVKPDLAELADLAVLNANSDKIDACDHSVDAKGLAVARLAASVALAASGTTFGTGPLTVTGVVTASSTLTVAALLTASAGITSGGTLTVSAGGASIVGTTTLAVTTISGLVTLNGGLTVATGATNMQTLTTCSAGFTVSGGNINLGAAGANLAFFGATNVLKQTVTGSRGANAALASLLTTLANYGLVTDSSS